MLAEIFITLTNVKSEVQVKILKNLEILKQPNHTFSYKKY